MKPNPPPTDPASPPDSAPPLRVASGSASELVAWLHEKLQVAEKAVVAREQAEACWRDGTNKEWKAVGNRQTKAQRVAHAKIEARIADKYRREVANFRAVIAALPNTRGADSQPSTIARRTEQPCELALSPGSPTFPVKCPHPQLIP